MHRSNPLYLVRVEYNPVFCKIVNTRILAHRVISCRTLWLHFLFVPFSRMKNQQPIRYHNHYGDLMRRLNLGEFDTGDPVAAFKAVRAEIFLGIADKRSVQERRARIANWEIKIPDCVVRITLIRHFLTELATRLANRKGGYAKRAAREIFKMREETCCTMTRLAATKEDKTFTISLNGCLAEWAPDFWKYGCRTSKKYATSKQNAAQAMPSQRAAARKRKLSRRYRRSGGA